MVVKGVLRHSSVKVTERYLRTLPEHLLDAVRVLDREGVAGLSQTQETQLTPDERGAKISKQDLPF